MPTSAYSCPVEVTMEVLGGKWTVVLLAHLKEGTLRTSELRRLTPAISEKMLTQRLRELESRGIVERTVVSSTPPHVEYALTPTGRTLSPALQALYDWGIERAAGEGLTITIAPSG